MNDDLIPEPFRFNPMKHHLGWIKDFIDRELEKNDPGLIKQIRHLGSSVMDVYTGILSVNDIIQELKAYLDKGNLLERKRFSEWAGTGYSDFRVAQLSDASNWTIKFYPDQARFIHFFPARTCPHSFRIKANTLKSAILYIIITGKDYINEDDLNRARAIAGLSPVKEISETEAISETIEILRNR